MQHNNPVVRRLEDYSVPDFFVNHTTLEIDLTQTPVRVKAQLILQGNPEYKAATDALPLDGKNMKLISVALNGKLLTADEYELTDESLTLKHVPLDVAFTVETEAELGDNPDLFGLYKTEGTWLVKAETEGMRRVIYCKDHPDVLSPYRTTIIAGADFPTLLSNGKLIAKETLSDGRHSATWEDLVPKPTYLFAMVASNTVKLTLDYHSPQDRTVPIEFYVRADAKDQCAYAMEILRRAMAWDEATYGLPCTLDSHKVAGVDKYASGASEPTGLNLFNTENLFATAAIKNDAGFLRVAEVVSHEFFHYWSGDRVTIRDWFNLTVKEGLTSFRAADFCEALFGEQVMRVINGKTLESGAPRVDNYTQVRSLYTTAAYGKSAEIFRMIRLVMGKERFYQSMGYFLKKHDGQAVTLEQMLQSLSLTSGMDVSPFMQWFTQEGVPVLTVTDAFDEEAQMQMFTFRQTGLGKDKTPCLIPVTMSLFDADGVEQVRDRTLLIDQAEQSFWFPVDGKKLIPSLLRNFSAPVQLKYDYTQEELLFLMQYDTNLFTRTEAATELMTRLVANAIRTDDYSINEQTLGVLSRLLQDETINPWVLSIMLALPSESTLLAGLRGYDLDVLLAAKEKLMTSIGQRLAPEFKTRLESVSLPVPAGDLPEFSMQAACNRRLQKLCLMYLSRVVPEPIAEECQQFFYNSLESNMTNTMTALEIMMSIGAPGCDEALESFYECWRHDPSAINNWIRLQTGANSSTTIATVEKLLNHPAFDITNPNKVIAVMVPFLSNTTGFHEKSGAGYALYARVILQLETVNPSLAATLTGRLGGWGAYDENRQVMMRDQLLLLWSQAKSDNVLSAAKKALEQPFTAKATVRPAASLLNWMQKPAQSTPGEEAKPSSAILSMK